MRSSPSGLISSASSSRSVYTYAARITDWRAGHVTVTEYATLVATSADAMTRTDRRLTDAEITEWLDEVAVNEWAAPEWEEEGRRCSRQDTDLTLSIERAEGQ